jgi:uncharacterized protein YdiU (UPF0061 family)
MSSLANSLDHLVLNNSFAALSDAFYTRLLPRGLNNPRLVHVNEAAAALIGLDQDSLRSPDFLEVFSGRVPLPGGDTLAAVYSGHQFGVWAGQLGDGRAHLLGEVCGPEGNWELQLKGAGMTPYSRMGDGRAVLRSSIREYLASQAMHGLGIPTTRALALIASDDRVVRETVETAAIVTRMAPSFIRFGSFEHWAARGEPDNLQILANYVIDRFYPECRQEGDDSQDQASATLRLLAKVTERTADLMAAWQSVGFCHGVMNTDNMSILGLTLDYGPFGFMDAFDMNHICNHTDSEGRYAWNRQPQVGLWNLYRLAGSLNVLIKSPDAIKAVLNGYEALFTKAFHARMAAKLGLDRLTGQSDAALLEDLLQLMHSQRSDFTLAFRTLSEAVRGNSDPFVDLFVDRESASAWLARLKHRMLQESNDLSGVAKRMDSVNPLYVLRNHLAEEAIKAAATGDATEIAALMNLLANPYIEQPGMQRYAQLPPDWARDIEVSCSS